MDENEVWVASMSARGYTRGPEFSSYEELTAWDGSNMRTHIRRRIGDKYQVYFTDGQPCTAQPPAEVSSVESAYDICDVPF